MSRLLAFYQQQESIDVSLDTVIFSNGRTIGSDSGAWVPRIKAWVDAKRDLAKQAEVAAASDLKEILIPIRDEALAALNTPELRQLGLALAAHRSTSYQETYKLAKGNFAAQMLESIQRNGAAAALAFIRDLSGSKTWPDIHR